MTTLAEVLRVTREEAIEAFKGFRVQDELSNVCT